MDIPALPLQNQEGRGRGTVPAPSLDSHLFFGGARPSHRFVRDLYFDLSTHYTISLCRIVSAFTKDRMGVYRCGLFSTQTDGVVC